MYHQFDDPFRIDFAFPDGTLETLISLFQRHGRVFRIRSLQRTQPTFVINDAHAIQHILGKNNRNYVKGVGIDRVQLLLGKGLIVSEGEQWKRQRKMIQPFFRQKTLNQFIQLMVKCNQHCIEHWGSLSQDPSPQINITNETSRVALSFTLRALFSKDLERLVDEHGHNPFDILTEEPSRDLQFARRFRALGKIVEEMTRRRNDAGRRPFDFLSMLMDARDKVTDQGMLDRQLLDEVFTLIVAGHETTASTLNWTWFLLSQYPEVEALLHRELEQVLDRRDPTLDDLGQLSYLRQILKEAMRLYPPVWMITRRAKGSDRIGAYEIEAGSDILISPYTVHRNPLYWSDPETFRPERFASEVEKNIPKSAYLPFSSGPRNCIGESLAMMEMMIHVAIVAQQLQLEYREAVPIELEAQVNLRPKNDLMMVPIAR